MSNTLISVVIPTYNRAKYLPRAIESVLAQTHSNWELIVVDSFSTDETPTLMQAYTAQDARIRLLQNPRENGRLPGALNTGFDAAHGMYHTWLQDDNYFTPDAFTIFADYLDTHPDVGLIYSAAKALQDDPPATYIRHAIQPHNLADKCIVTPSFMYRAEVYQRIGKYRAEYFLAEDYDFWMRAYTHFKFVPIPDILQMYHYHGETLTETVSRPDIDDAVKRSLVYMLDHEAWTRDPYLRCRMYLYLSNLSYRHGFNDDGAKYRWLAFRQSPWVVLRREILKPMTRLLGKGVRQKLFHLVGREPI